MANGKITASDGGWPAQETQSVLPFFIRHPLQPNEWNDFYATTKQQYKIRVWRQVNVKVSNYIKDEISMKTMTSLEDTLTGAIVAAWSQHDESPFHSKAYSLGPYIGGTFSSNEESPAYQLIQHEFYTDDNAANNEMLNVHIATRPQDNIADSDPSCSDHVWEELGSEGSGGNWSPFAPQRSCSSWLGKTICKSLNKILHSTRAGMSVPL